MAQRSMQANDVYSEMINTLHVVNGPVCLHSIPIITNTTTICIMVIIFLSGCSSMESYLML